MKCDDKNRQAMTVLIKAVRCIFYLCTKRIIRTPVFQFSQTCLIPYNLLVLNCILQLVPILILANQLFYARNF